METQNDYLKKNRITIDGKDYYMIPDFIRATGIKTSTAYQMIARENIPSNHILKLNGVIFISAIEVDDRVRKEIRRQKIDQILKSEKLDNLADDKLDELNKLLNS